MAAAISVAIAGQRCARTRSGAARPNVVIIVIDALRQDHLPMYGYARNTSPFLARLARQSAVFDAMSPTSWTKPAVASLLTGLHPVRHQAFGRTDLVPPDVVTLPELLSENGYRCFGITANAWISAQNGFLPGFRTLDVIGPTQPLSPANAQLVNLTALPRIRNARSPFFAYVHYVDTHLPYRPAVSWDGKPLPPDQRQSISELDLQTAEPLNRPEATLRRAVDLYDGGIRQVDAAIEDVFKVLRQRGDLDNTIVIITADHGEEFQEHGRMGHGHSLYQEVIRVPMLISGPGVRPGVRKGIATLVDVVPTLVDILGLGSRERTFDGSTLRAVLGDPGVRVADRDLLFHLDYSDPTGQSAALIPAAALAFIRNGSKLVLSRTPFEKSVFDLDDDPAEARNAYGDDQPLTSALGTALAAKYNDLSRQKQRRVTIVGASESQAAIAALGYVSGGTTPEPRIIPGEIRPPDAFRDGRLGWARDLDACIHTANGDQAKQLLSGWHDAEADGRWTAGTATAVLPMASLSEGHLMISGRNAQPRTVRVTIDIGDVPVAEKDLLPGPFIWNIPLPAHDSSVVRIVTNTIYRPSDFGSPDTRELGLFVQTLCVE